jgi:hypothetical protein
MAAAPARATMKPDPNVALIETALEGVLEPVVGPEDEPEPDPEEGGVAGVVVAGGAGEEGLLIWNELVYDCSGEVLTTIAY